MGYCIELEFLSKSVHDLSKFYRIPVVFGQYSFRRRSRSNWCWVYVFLENFDENNGILESLINPEDNSTNLIYRFADIILPPYSLVA